MRILIPLILMLQCHTEYRTCFSLQGTFIKESNQSFVHSGHGIRESDGYNVGISL